MRAGIRRASAAAVVAFGWALVGVGTVDAEGVQAAQFGETQGPLDGTDEEEARDELEALVGEARSAESAAPLARNTVLDEMARAEAQRMADLGAPPQSGHTSRLPDGAVAAAVNAGSAASALDLHEQWLESPEHRATLLGDHTHVGIAAVVENDATWGVEVFADFSPPGTASGGPAEALGAARLVEDRPTRGFVPVPRESEPPAAENPDGLSSLPAAVLTGSMAEDSAMIGVRIGMAAVVILAASIVVPKFARRMGFARRMSVKGPR